MRSLLVWIALTTSLLAQPPVVLKNAKVQEHSASAGLEAAVQKIVAAEDGEAWVAYAVPVIDGDRSMCCWRDVDHAKGRAGSCTLGRSGSFFNGTRDDGGLPPMQKDEFYVFLHVQTRRVDKVRVFSQDCGIDAQGLRVHWINAVEPAQSVRYLAALAQPANDEDGTRQAVDAIAQHRDAGADAALEKLMASGRREQRKHAAFWIANSRGRRGFEVLKAAMAREGDADVRQAFIFAFTQSPEQEAKQELLRLARQDSDPDVRGEAIFWLAQQAGKKVAGDISEAVERDPDTEVKKKAVFALSQMEGGEGVPHLIRIARSHSNREVRKQAMFWLGQSRDARALELIEQVLAK